MFCIELKFVNDCLHKSFKPNIKLFHRKIPVFEKNIYEEKNSIGWSGNSKICDFPLDMSMHDAQNPAGEITYFDFLILKEYKFIINIFDKEDL